MEKGDSLRNVRPYLENLTLVEKAGLSSKSGTLFRKGGLKSKKRDSVRKLGSFLKKGDSS